MGDIVKVVKRGKFVGWYIRYKDADGRRRQRASHQPTRALAARMLVEVEARVARGLVGVPEIKPAAEVTVGQLIDRFLAEHSPARSKDPVRYKAKARRGLAQARRCFAEMSLAELTTARLEAWRDELRRRYRPNTVRACFQPLGTALSWAVRQGLIGRSPAAGLVLPKKEHSLEYLSGQEAADVLAMAERRARRTGDLEGWSGWVATALALKAGLRRGEVCGLRWQDVDLAFGRLTVARSYDGPTKSDRPRHLPLSKDLAALLSKWRPKCPPTSGGWVCPAKVDGGEFTMAGRGSRHGLPTLLRAVGRGGLHRPWHALRHTFASHFVMNGGNILTLQRILGHSTVQQTLCYAHLAPDFMAGELDRVAYKK